MRKILFLTFLMASTNLYLHAAAEARIEAAAGVGGSSAGSRPSTAITDEALTEEEVARRIASGFIRLLSDDDLPPAVRGMITISFTSGMISMIKNYLEGKMDASEKLRVIRMLDGKKPESILPELEHGEALEKIRAYAQHPAHKSDPVYTHSYWKYLSRKQQELLMMCYPTAAATTTGSASASAR